LEGGEVVEKGDRRFTIPPHQAVLVVDARAVRGSTKEHRLEVTRPGDAHSHRLFQLDREVLEIGSGEPGFSVRSNGFTGPLPNISVPDELHDIRWVPPLDKCAQGPIPFDEHLLDLDTLRPLNRLAAVVRLDRGRLETTDVHRDDHDQPLPFEFQSSSGIHRQALARTFRLRVPVEQDEATLILTDADGNDRSLVVGRHEGCLPNEEGEPVVELEVFNRELERVLGLEMPPNLLLQAAQQEDTDFVIFYRLSPRWNALSPDDMALPRRGGPGGGGGSARPCEPPQYTGFGG
ncbi:MAG: hypothetical protein ACJ76J_11075, partial [Thermoanaerobaculia bacterium]